MGSWSKRSAQVPQPLQEGTWMTKVSGKKQKKMFLRLDPDMGHIIWQSKQPRIIPLENIKEIRSGPSTCLHQNQSQPAHQYDLWLTIIYILDAHYKILHLVAPSQDIFHMWDSTLRRLHAHRMNLMTGLGNIEERQRVWEKQYWKGADLDRDQRLTFEEVEKLCRRLNINSPRDALHTWFKQADVQERRYLDFEDFRRFVKLLKTRKEITLLFDRLKGSSEHFDLHVFSRFMQNEQKSNLPSHALDTLFQKYSVPVPTPPPSNDPSTPPFPPIQQRTLTPETLTTFLLSPDNAPFASPSHSSLPPKPNEPDHSTITTTTSSLPSTKHDMTHPLSSYFISSSHNTYLVGHQLVGSSTVEGYIRALLAGCRSVEIDIYDGSGSEEPPSSPIPNGASSVGAIPSTSSLVNEPMVFHGHTLTSKVPLRQICQAIMKYGFIASPYPIIISAENHCSIQGQEQTARIMIEEFRDALVRYPNDGPDLGNVLTPTTVTSTSPMTPEEGNWKGKGRITQLPSPEDLKGRILLKTKNLMLGKSDSINVQKRGNFMSSESDIEPSSSASESEPGFSGVSTMFGRGLYRSHSERSKTEKKKNGEGSPTDLVREGIIRASSVIQRVRSVKRSAAPPTHSPISDSSGLTTTSNVPIPISVNTGTPCSTPPPSSPQITSPPLLSSPPPLLPPLPLPPSLPLSVPLPIPVSRNRSSPFVPPAPHTHPYSLPSSVASASSVSSSTKQPALTLDNPTKPLPAQLGTLSSSYPSSPSLISSSLGASSGVPLSLVTRSSSRNGAQKPKPKMSKALVALLVYTVGVKCRGFRRKSHHIYLHSDENGSVSDSKSIKSTKSKGKVKEKGEGCEEEEQLYAPEHMFSLSENNANKMLRTCMLDLIEHTEGHLVRVYPKGTRMRSTNFEPHRYWSAGCQLVAINWQTFDLGYVINHAMFQRNARCGYVLKPPPLRHLSKPEHSPNNWRKKRQYLNITIISAQQLPRVKVKDGSGHEVLGMEKERDKETYEEGREAKEKEGKTVDPYVEASLHVPEWTHCVSPSTPSSTAITSLDPIRFATTSAKTHTSRTPTIKNNGFNPIWNHAIQIPFDAPTQPGMFDLIFLRLLVKQESSTGVGPYSPDAETLAGCCVSLGEIREGYRHLPLYDAMLSQYLFSTLFVKVNIL